MRLFLSPPHQSGDELQLLQEALASNYLAPAGPQLERLDRDVPALLGFRHGVSLNSATAGLHLAIRHLLALRAASLNPDPRPPLVLASSLTFIASVSPALFCGCEVRLIDAEPESWTLDPFHLHHALEDAAAENRPVLAVIPTDLYGQCCDLDAICGLCDPRGIPVLLDAAESLGAVFTGSSRPWASVVSFNGNKIITGSGGGSLVSDDAALIAHAAKLAQQAREPLPYYEHRELGYNYRMSNLVAAVVLAQLPSLPQRVERRRQIFERYQSALADLPGITWMPESPWNRSTRWLSVLTLDAARFGAGPEDLRLALEASNIESRPVWKPLHLQPALQGLRFYGDGVSDAIFQKGLCLPSGSGMSDADQDRVCDLLRRLHTDAGRFTD
jgi:dTDP-4-amino-4,6-dideoxygalactose transaminase